MPDVTEVSSLFRVMNTDVRAIVCAGESQAEKAAISLRKVQDTFIRVESVLSRFDSESELSSMNRSAGSPLCASRTLFRVVSLAMAAAGATNGIFDPTVLPDLISAGYDTSFEMLPERRETGPGQPAGVKRAAWRDVILDPVHSTVYLPAGVSLDLGGIGKGWAVDYACRHLQNFKGYAVDAGGDIRMGGARADGSPWTVGVDDPYHPGRNLAVLRLIGGAVCTSTTARRSWQIGGAVKHHLIDPRYGLPADSGVVSATVVAGSAVWAEIIAKTALILGPEEGLRFIRSRRGAQGILVLQDGSLIITDGLKELIGVEKVVSGS